MSRHTLSHSIARALLPAALLAACHPAQAQTPPQGSGSPGGKTDNGTIHGTIQGTIDGTLNGTIPGSVPGTIPGTAATHSSGGFTLISPIVQPTLSPGVIQLMELEGRFEQAVAEGGGKAFASFFADDAVALSNGKPAVLGRGAIAANANWSPKEYQLTWVAQGAQMGPSNDMGFTWGHYAGRSTDHDGHAVVTTGRYITVWRKLKDGSWKVAMDASATEPPGAGECCSLPKP